MYRLTDYGSMLADRRRVEAYRRALAAVITPSSVVLDIGAGLGTFSLLAAKLGAARVYAVEPADVIKVAKNIAEANGVGDRITFIQTHAAELELPEQVDVIVSDLAGALPLFGEHLPSIIHVRDRFLRPGGALIPDRDRLMCAPLSSAEVYAQIVEPWRSLPEIDLSVAERMALNATYALPIQPSQIVAEPKCWATLDYGTITSPNVRAEVEWRLDAPAIIHGIALWFESGLGFSSGPWHPDSVQSTMVLPLIEPLPIDAGEELRVAIWATLASGQYVMTWQVGTGVLQGTLMSEPARVNNTSGAPAHVIATTVGDETLLLDLAAGIYHVLNDTGARVWQLMTEGKAVQAIVKEIAAEYDVDEQTVATDVASVVLQLKEASLIE
jgi:SAM-dependent methyltransferase